jgi:hypothetical protein
MLPLPVTVMGPPLLEIGPEVGVAMIWGDGRQPARATPGAPSAASAKADAPASSAAREFLSGENQEAADEFAALAETQTFVGILNI